MLSLINSCSAVERRLKTLPKNTFPGLLPEDMLARQASLST